VNKSQLIDKIAAGADISKAAAGRALDALIACLWVATSTGSTLFNSKSTEPYQRNIIPSLQRFSN
jgi:hypothetical protein